MGEERRLLLIRYAVYLLSQEYGWALWCETHKDICGYLSHTNSVPRGGLDCWFVYLDRSLVLKNVLEMLN